MKKTPIILLLLIILAFTARGALATDIFKASSDGNLAEVKALLKKKPDLVNAQDKDGITPLHYAVRYGHTNVAEFLISKGADVNANKNTWKVTPLH